MKEVCTKRRFFKDVKAHKLIVIQDDGLYRNIRLSQPGSSVYSFSLVTWPGHLCYTGDMGTYVFSRINDMFEFFRSDRNGLHINPGYWEEKCLAADRHGSITKYSPERLKRRIKEWLKDEKASKAVRQAVEDEILSYADDESEEGIRRRVIDFEHDGFLFHDFWEIDLTEYTYRYIWCCYAIVWGIKQYDKTKRSGCRGGVKP